MILSHIKRQMGTSVSVPQHGSQMKKQDLENYSSTIQTK